MGVILDPLLSSRDAQPRAFGLHATRCCLHINFRVRPVVTFMYIKRLPRILNKMYCITFKFLVPYT